MQSVTRTRLLVRCHGIGPIVLTFLGLLTIIGVPVSRAVPQTAATGALIGEVLDPTGKGIPGASVELKNQEMAASRSTVSDEEGRFVFTLLPPGIYQVIVQKEGYSQAKSAVSVSVRVIGTDGMGTAFGDSGTGIVDGPGQVNLDLSISKLTARRTGQKSITFRL